MMMMVLVVLKGSCSVLVAATPTQSRSSNSDTSMMVRGELVTEAPNDRHP